MSTEPPAPKDRFKSPTEANRPGVYVLFVSLAEGVDLAVGRLGTLSFPAGGYAYVGSGMRGVEARIRRHLQPHKRPTWHLDYLLPQGDPATAILGHTTQRLECPLAYSLGESFQVFPRFGSSDCCCPGHLFWAGDIAAILNSAIDAFQTLGCTPTVIPLKSAPGSVVKPALLRCM